LKDKIKNLTILEKQLLGKQSKKIVSVLIKVVLTFVALYVVFSKIDIIDLKKIFFNINFYYLVLALLFFNVSKIVSSVRLNIYFSHIGVKISELYALKLYYIGMFYNLFLPGGIGGDGYKIYLLKKDHQHVAVKDFLGASVLDRISGLAPLLFFAGLLFLFSKFYTLYFYIDYIVIAGTILTFPSLYLLTKYLFNRYLPLYFKTTIFGSLVQFLQLVSAFFIIYSIGVQDFMIEYMVLFLLSSVVAVLPISVGGIGIREVTFLYGLSLISLDSTNGVAFALLFFLITAISSFIGIFFQFGSNNSRDQ